MAATSPAAYYAQLLKQRAALQLVEEVPPSRPGSPEPNEELVRKIRAAVDATKGNTSDGKWAHVSNMLRLECTSRRYRTTGGRVRVKDEQGKYTWVLPEEKPAEIEEKEDATKRTINLVKQWQTAVPLAPELLEPMEQSQQVESSAPAVLSSAGIAFPAIKRSSVPKTKAGPSKLPAASTPPAKPKKVAEPPHALADISELSFMPPSFDVISSTPHPKHARERVKPVPISIFSSSPHPGRLAAAAERLLGDERPFPSSSAEIPARVDKRQRSRSPVGEEKHTPKRARHVDTMVPLRGETPPPDSEDPSHRGRSVSPARSLGNARRLPMGPTPMRGRGSNQASQEILAGSRKIQPRPRPPSRNRSRQAGSTPTMNVRTNRPTRTPSPPPAKSFFSSPASSASDSPTGAEMFAHPGLPSSPSFANFTANPGAFEPRFQSSQQPAGGQDAGGSQGFLGFGYNSQYDADRDAADFSALLEKDTDVFKKYTMESEHKGTPESDDEEEE